ncbi:unnamed protein product [Dicrocoelium dendriticum]|nr:unnamed protein product [Dicrocoelium dendriticum]CAH8491303.1 unnamed protein product [Dicrocoelium dendriticum]
MPSKNEGTNDVKGWYHKTCTAPGRLDGKLAVVTGASTGIGEVTAAELARRGCKVIMACRDLKRAQAAVDRILDKYGPSKPDSVKLNVADSSVIQYLSVVQPDQLVVEMLDLASLQSVREFASRISSKYDKLDYLINNAGIIQTKIKKSVDGFELTLATNHLGPFLLTELLTPMLKRAAPSRIINVSSMVHYNAKVWKPNLFIPEKEYSDLTAYNWSKLANVMHAKELSRRLQGTGVTAVSLHPGIVKTELARDLSGAFSMFLMKLVKPLQITPWQGAQTTLYTVLTKSLDPGAYYSNCAWKEASSAALNEEDCKWLWMKSCELVGISST